MKEQPNHNETPCWTDLEVVLIPTGLGLWRWEVRGNYWTAGNHVARDHVGVRSMGLFINRDNALRAGEKAASCLTRKSLRVRLEEAVS